MDRRQFCRSAVAAGVAATWLPGCSRETPQATQADTSIPAVSLDGAEIELGKAAVREFGEAMSGPVMLSGHPQFDSARAVWNGMHDKRPALIARCMNSDDVSKAVSFASDNSLLVAVRGGGHTSDGNPDRLTYSTVASSGPGWDGTSSFRAPVSGAYYFSLSGVKDTYKAGFTPENTHLQLRRGTSASSPLLGSALSGRGTGLMCRGLWPGTRQVRQTPSAMATSRTAAATRCETDLSNTDGTTKSGVS